MIAQKPAFQVVPEFVEKFKSWLAAADDPENHMQFDCFTIPELQAWLTDMVTLWYAPTPPEHTEGSYRSTYTYNTTLEHPTYTGVADVEPSEYVDTGTGILEVCETAQCVHFYSDDTGTPDNRTQKTVSVVSVHNHYSAADLKIMATYWMVDGQIVPRLLRVINDQINFDFGYYNQLLRVDCKFILAEGLEFRLDALISEPKEDGSYDLWVDGELTADDLQFPKRVKIDVTHKIIDGVTTKVWSTVTTNDPRTNVHELHVADTEKIVKSHSRIGDSPAYRKKRLLSDGRIFDGQAILYANSINRALYFDSTNNLLSAGCRGYLTPYGLLQSYVQNPSWRADYVTKIIDEYHDRGLLAIDPTDAVDSIDSVEVSAPSMEIEPHTLTSKTYAFAPIQMWNMPIFPHQTLLKLAAPPAGTVPEEQKAVSVQSMPSSVWESVSAFIKNRIARKTS